MGAAVRALLTGGTRRTFAADFASSFVLFKQNFGFWGGSYMKLLARVCAPFSFDIYSHYEHSNIIKVRWVKRPMVK